MKKQKSMIMVHLIMLPVLFLFLSITHGRAEEINTGLISNKPEAFSGYTLYAPLMSTTTYLIDMEGRVVHTWSCASPPGNAVYLLDNGHLLRTGSLGPGGNPTFQGGGAGGVVQELDWDGNPVWEFIYSSEGHLLHHDIEKMPNGNILMIAWEKKTRKEAIAAGRDPKTVGPEGLWSDYIIEVRPSGKKGGRIVWEWHVWDHLIQTGTRGFLPTATTRQNPDGSTSMQQTGFRTSPPT